MSGQRLGALVVSAVLWVASAAAAQENDLAGFSASFLDQSVDPCQDFYAYACGGWMKAHPIPSDRSAWDRYYQLEEVSHAAVRQIVEQASAKPKGANEQRIGDYYAACMDDAAIEKKGLAPLGPELKRIRAVHDLPSMATELAHLHALGVYAGFELRPAQDMHDARQLIAELDQGGTALADRDDYLNQDARAVERQQRFRQHVAAMLRLAGESEQQAADDSERVWRIEKALATASMSRKARRDPNALYHKLARAELEALAPTFPWKDYLRAVGAPALETVNVMAPGFLKGLEALLHSEDPAAWRAYFTWALLDLSAALLPAALKQQDFDFYQRYLHGVSEAPPRWKQCGRLVNRDLGDEVGRLYVERFFPGERKALMQQLVGAVEQAMEADITSLEWMTEATRKQALDKLHKVTTKIGNPEVWRDYRALKVKRDDALGNRFRAREFAFRYRLAKLGKPLDRAEWFEPPQVIDGFYSSTRNEILFTAGILQPPFVDTTLGDAVILGEVGRMIGHELIHGFDDEGRKFDGNGDLRDWWTAEDAKAYEQRAACFADEYSRFVAVEEVHVDGKLTLGENLADNGGLQLAYGALHRRPPATPEGPKPLFSDDQRFFLAFAQSQCANIAPKTQRQRATTDVHAPPRWRVNGSVQNMEAFEKAFSCKPGTPMAPVKRCRVW